MPVIFNGLTIPEEFVSQYARAVSKSWLPVFQAEARTYGLTTALALAIASRETGNRNIRGDFRGGQYHGFGLMQIDRGTDPAWCEAWTAENAEPGITRGCQIWAQKLAQARAAQRKQASVKGRVFVLPELAEDELRRLATAAYNCGLWSAYHYSKKQSPDSSTTGKDYSRNVYDRAMVFACLLAHDSVEPDAVKREVAAQGRFARPEHRLLAGEANVAPSAVAEPGLAENAEEPEEIVHADYDDHAVIGRAPDNGQNQTAGVQPTAVVTVPAVRPADPPQPSPLESAKKWLALLPGSIVGYAASGAEAVKNLPPVAIGGIILLVVVAGIVYFYFRDREAERTARLVLMNQQSAEKLTLAQIQTAADPNKFTVHVG